jgi:hypothetical protein
MALRAEEVVAGLELVVMGLLVVLVVLLATGALEVLEVQGG